MPPKGVRGAPAVPPKGASEPIRELTLEQFSTWRAQFPPEQVAHAKGFARGMQGHELNEALEAAADCSLVAWDGDRYDRTGFTTLVVRLLRSSPDRHAVAFKKRADVRGFHASWDAVAREFPGRIVVVAVDLDADAARFGIADELDSDLLGDLPSSAKEFYMLGRIGLKATGSRHVVALGGGGVTACEAKVSLNEGVAWTVFSIGRNRHEVHQTLADYAADLTPADGMTFVGGFDTPYMRGTNASAAMGSLTSALKQERIASRRASGRTAAVPRE